MASATLSFRVVNSVASNNTHCEKINRCSACTTRTSSARGSSFTSIAFKPSHYNTVKKNKISYKQTISITCMAGKVAITGATGFVGSALVERLLEEGNTVKVLTRNASKASNKLPKGEELEIYEVDEWGEAVKGCSAVVNLAGEPIATRWSESVKQEIIGSRVNATEALVDAVNACNLFDRPGVFVSASAIGFYGTSQDAVFKESSKAGDDFLSEVCVQWEKAASKAKTRRAVTLRLGIVLDNGGGAIARMKPIFQLGGGGPLGSGEQWFSWIHRDDVVEMIMQAIQNSKWKGVYNATAPTPVRVSEMSSALGQALFRPSLVPVPAFVLETLLGEGATLVLDGQQVLPTRALDAKFQFKYNTVLEAMQAIAK